MGKFMDRGSKLLELIRSGLAQHTVHTTSITLGDRSNYIGMSDIGAYVTCPRMAVMNRLHPEKKDNSLSKLLTLNRGHWFEDGIAAILKNLNIPHVRQLEIGIDHDFTEIKAHLDFVLVSTHPKPTVRILEIKSCQKLPETLYSSYEMQVYGQVGLLHRHWDGPAFSYTDEHGAWHFGGLSFPEAAHKLWGIKLPDDVSLIDIEAWVLCLSMTDAKVFGPYRADYKLLEMSLDAGSDLWKDCKQIEAGATDLARLPTAVGFNPICSSCDWNTDCPKFSGKEHPELKGELDELLLWKQERADLDSKIKARESAMKDWYELANLRGEWIQAGNQRFRAVETVGRRALDKDSLMYELAEIFATEDMDDIDVQALITRHERVGEPSTRLFVTQVNS